MFWIDFEQPIIRTGVDNSEKMEVSNFFIIQDGVHRNGMISPVSQNDQIELMIGGTARTNSLHDRSHYNGMNVMNLNFL